MRSLHLRRHLRRRQPIYHPRERWTVSPTSHHAPCSYPYRLLRLDAQFPQHYEERSSRPQAERQSLDVQEIVVVHPRQHPCHLRLLLLQLLHLRLS